MSTIYSFVCDDCQVYTDVGQSYYGDGFILWISKGEAYSAAERFLANHVSHRLRILTDDEISKWLYKAYEELSDT